MIQARILGVMLAKKGSIDSDELNNRIKGLEYEVILEGLSLLLEKGVIAVSNRRFWIRDKAKCMSILHGQTPDT